MNYRQLGLSDLHVSVIGLGTMSWPGCHFGQKGSPDAPVDREEIKNQLTAALDCGVNLIDTAPGYGQGFAEELVGSLLHEMRRRKEVILVTKVGPLFDSEIIAGRDTNLSASHVRDCCESSLRRLQTDCLDLYLAHRPDTQTPIEETCLAMENLKEEGKIRWFGVSNFSNELLASAQQSTSVIAHQIPYSLADRNIEKDRLPFCHENHVGVMAYSPLGKGILTGKYTQTDLPPSEDYRHQRPHFTGNNLPRNLRLADRVRELADGLAITSSQLVLAWALAQTGISTVLPGSKSLAQVRDNAGAGTISLAHAVVKELNDLSL
jgi:aryl-alcohol dehydrogenase-like predicted oxidoreductase